MQITIKNCNCIDEAKIDIAEGKLNLKFAINGTGKTTISRAIQLSAKGPDALKELLPFKHLANANDPNCFPAVTGAESVKSIRVFDEGYISQFVFRQDEVISNSFEIFIRTPEYDKGMQEIEAAFREIKETFAKDAELDEVINDLRELSSSFGKSAGGYSKAGAMHKGLGTGNKLENIPAGLESYKTLLQSTSNVKWLKWQISGKEFLNISSDCPYCVTPTDATKKQAILSIEKEYDSKAIEHLNNVLKVLESLADYFSDDTKNKLRKITTNKATISDEEINYLRGVKQDVDTLESKLSALKNISFFSFKQVDKVVDKLAEQKIGIEYLTRLDSPKTREIADAINATLDGLLKKATDIQKAIGIQRSNIQKTIQAYRNEINSFLQYAGYKYVVEVDNENDVYKMRLRHLDSQTALEKGSQYLSYGERNAFSLVLFMYEVIKENPDLIVLDDPISSFDKNKKFAILNTLFRGKRSLKDKMVLMLTHDLEPIIDVVHTLANNFNFPSATFLHAEGGAVTEVPITRDDILTFSEVCKENIASGCDDIIKLVYLRRDFEVKGDKGTTYHLISNLLHKRPIPKWIDSSGERDMTSTEIADAMVNVAAIIPGFEYAKLLQQVSDDVNMMSLYNATSSNYEKLQMYRIINIGKNLHESDIIAKFINEAFHIENEYLMQLNPRKYQTTPKFIIDECDQRLNA